MDVQERITVGAVFSAGTVRPAWFTWRGRKYAVEEVTYTWESKEGLAKLRHFSVVVKGNVYVIAYDPVACAWDIRGVEQDWRE